MQKKKSLKDLFLVIIHDYSGKYAWYDLASALQSRRILVNLCLLRHIEPLIIANLVFQQLDPNHPELAPKYFITDAGRLKVKELYELYGASSFRTKIEHLDDYELEW